MGRDVRFSKSLYPSIILDRYRLAFMSLPTVEWGPTLSAERKILDEICRISVEPYRLSIC
jgi:hypothetical protein